MSFSVAAIVPSYNHYRHIGNVVAALRGQNLRIFIIDDGSAEPAKSALAALHDPAQGITLHRLDQNGGKGGAVMEGFQLAAAEGFTHALQVDADGQHDLTALPGLIALAETHPDALVSGQPIYDATIPAARKIARWITHVWVWVETLSAQITDSMCGYRVYPLKSALDVMDSEPVGHYMDFDTEIMVRMNWRGTPVVMLPVNVTYPPDNSSNFRMVADNWRITKMHTRLVFGMLRRLPRLLMNRRREPAGATHWAGLNERGALLGLWLMFAFYKIAGRRLCGYAMQPVLLYFFLTGSEQRRASRDYWRRLYAYRGEAREPDIWQLWRHYRSFGRMALDKVAAWLGDITPADLLIDDAGELDRIAATRTGVVVFTSHLGNVEVSRALAEKRGANRITVFAHTRNAMRFNRLLAAYNPASAIHVMEVEDIGPATLIELEERLARGDWIVIAGDRIPLSGDKRITEMAFLGAPARFSEGPVIIASLLKCPVYVLNCMAEGQNYRIFFEKISDQIVLSRRREEDIREPLAEYVRILQETCQKYPDQWYNFFDFWALPGKSGKDKENS
ncbi:MAG: glycosyltransferase family 2 protein [Sneathiella sp.]|nr:glycosyltransferase family 2 protein [Sneathiella sp.]